MPLRYNFKAFPIQSPTATFPSSVWRPVLSVVLFYGHARTVPIECIVDTGSNFCLFDAQIGEALGIDVNSGAELEMGGVAKGMKAKFYFHRIRISVAGSSYELWAGFSNSISVGGLLGQMGFFDKFIVTFDHTPNPPYFEVQEILRH